MPSYTAEELEHATGFDRRTIAYYVQKGLIPKVGRRGPRTRYPKLVMDRLLFIRRVRDAEQAGEVEAVTLSVIRAIFERLSPELIAQVAAKQLPAAAAVGDAPGPLRRSAGARSQSREGAWFAAEARASPRPHSLGADGETPPDALVEEPAARYSMGDRRALDMPPLEAAANEQEADLGGALSELQTRARKRRRQEPGSLDRWSRVDVSPDIALSVRGLTDADAPLLESVVQQLRRLISGRGSRRHR